MTAKNWNVGKVVFWAVDLTVCGALDGTVRHDPPHPSLVDFLSSGKEAP
jgi:hypothetical protein